MLISSRSKGDTDRVRNVLETHWLKIMTASMDKPERRNEGHSQVFRAERLASVSIRQVVCLPLIKQSK